MLSNVTEVYTGNESRSCRKACLSVAQVACGLLIALSHQESAQCGGDRKAREPCERNSSRYFPAAHTFTMRRGAVSATTSRLKFPGIRENVVEDELSRAPLLRDTWPSALATQWKNLPSSDTALAGIPGTIAARLLLQAPRHFLLRFNNRYRNSLNRACQSI
jgi:hypothetical protein